MTWLVFAMMTVVTWGLYALCLHTGQTAMGGEAASARMKAFLFVGVAYFLIAVLAPLAILVVKGATWEMSGKGVTWSLIAGTMGAVGALGVLLALGAPGGRPAVVMSIVFAGAPVVNAVVAILLDRPAGGISKIPWPFFLGILMAATGGYLVARFKPPPSHPPKPESAVTAPAPPVAPR